jgi:hypothetical protein
VARGYTLKWTKASHYVEKGSAKFGVLSSFRAFLAVRAAVPWQSELSLDYRIQACGVLRKAFQDFYFATNGLPTYSYNLRVFLAATHPSVYEKRR